MADPDQEIISSWIESIPDSARLFMRIHVMLVPNRQLHPGIFREQRGAMSVDWEKYSTAEQTRLRAREPNKNGIIALVAGAVRAIDQMTVKHEPIRANRAHTGIHGLSLPASLPGPESKTMRRLKLFRLVQNWEISP